MMKVHEIHDDDLGAVIAVMPEYEASIYHSHYADTGIVLMCEDDSGICGVLSAECSIPIEMSMLRAHKYRCNIQHIWIRNEEAAELLIKEVTKFAARWQCVAIQYICTSGGYTAKVLEEQGYAMTKAVYRKEVQPNVASS